MIETLVTYIDEISQGNQMIAGALALAVSGSIGFFVTRLPRTVMDFIKNQCVTSLTLNNSDWTKQQTFIKISKFLHELTTETGSRTLVLDSCWMDGKDVMVLTMGYGNHFFFYQKKLLWLHRSKLDSSGSDRLKEEITLYAFGRSHKVFEQLLKDNTPELDDTFINFSEFDGSWKVMSKIKKVPLDSLAMDADVRESFTGELEYFFNNEDVYRKLGLPYKTTMVLHGVPGSGKSSIIRSLASEYSLNICNISLSGVSDKSFKEAITTAPDKSIIVIEDFDSASATHKRSNVQTLEGVEKEESNGDSVIFEGFLTLSGILNTLDGVASLDGRITIMTTNCIDSIDPALIRSGRVDKLIELPKVSGQAVKDHFERLYNTTIDFEIKDLSAKEINAIVFECKNDAEKLKEYINNIRRN